MPNKRHTALPNKIIKPDTNNYLNYNNSEKKHANASN